MALELPIQSVGYLAMALIVSLLMAHAIFQELPLFQILRAYLLFAIGMDKVMRTNAKISLKILI